MRRLARIKISNNSKKTKKRLAKPRLASKMSSSSTTTTWPSMMRSPSPSSDSAKAFSGFQSLYQVKKRHKLTIPRLRKRKMMMTRRLASKGSIATMSLSFTGAKNCIR